MCKKEECFAYHTGPLGWTCGALNVTKCEFPNCRTFKTREQIIEQKKKCKARIDSYPESYRQYLILKYGEYDTGEDKKSKF